MPLDISLPNAIFRFRRRHPHLATELERTLLDAQTNASEQDRSLWLLIEEPDYDPNGW